MHFLIPKKNLSQVESDLEFLDKLLGIVGIDVQHIEEIGALYFVQIAIR